MAHRYRMVLHEGAMSASDIKVEFAAYARTGA